MSGNGPVNRGVIVRKKKTFVMFMCDHHGDGRLAVGRGCRDNGCGSGPRMTVALSDVGKRRSAG
jgi:hypothetical protein